MDRSQPASSNLMDTHNRLVADILTRYRTLMMLATIQAEGERNNANPEAIAVTGISMKMEFDGLASLPPFYPSNTCMIANANQQYTSIKELLTLSRKVKELWVFGPLGRGDPNARAKEDQIDRDVARVAGLLGGLESSGLRDLADRCGGTWEALGGAGGGAAAAAGGGGEDGAGAVTAASSMMTGR